MTAHLDEYTSDAGLRQKRSLTFTLCPTVSWPNFIILMSLPGPSGTPGLSPQDGKDWISPLMFNELCSAWNPSP